MNINKVFKSFSKIIILLILLINLFVLVFAAGEPPCEDNKEQGIWGCNIGNYGDEIFCTDSNDYSGFKQCVLDQDNSCYYWKILKKCDDGEYCEPSDEKRDNSYIALKQNKECSVIKSNDNVVELSQKSLTNDEENICYDIKTISYDEINNFNGDIDFVNNKPKQNVVSTDGKIVVSLPSLDNTPAKIRLTATNSDILIKSIKLTPKYHTILNWMGKFHSCMNVITPDPINSPNFKTESDRACQTYDMTTYPDVSISGKNDKTRNGIYYCDPNGYYSDETFKTNINYQVESSNSEGSLERSNLGYGINIFSNSGFEILNLNNVDYISVTSDGSNTKDESQNGFLGNDYSESWNKILNTSKKKHDVSINFKIPSVYLGEGGKQFLVSAWVKSIRNPQGEYSKPEISILDKSNEQKVYEEWTRIYFKSDVLNSGSQIITFSNGYFDNVQIEPIIEQDYPSKYYYTTQISGCCPNDYCWSGEYCVESSTRMDSETAKNTFTSDKSYFCGPKGTWVFGELKYDWTDGKAGLCENPSNQCFVYNDGEKSNYCVNSKQSVYDFYCENAKWTTKTKLVATALYNFAEANADSKTYTLACGNYNDVLNDYSYTIDSVSIEDYIKGIGLSGDESCETSLEEPYQENDDCIGNVCVLIYKKYGEKNVLFGSSVSRAFNADNDENKILNFYKTLGLDSNSCSKESNTLTKCGSNPVWYDAEKMIFIYGNNIDTNSFKEEEGLGNNLFDILKNFVSSLIGKNVQTSDEKDSNFEMIERMNLFNKLYLHKNSSNYIFAIDEIKYNHNPSVDDYQTPIETFVMKISGFNEIGNVCKSFANYEKSNFGFIGTNCTFENNEYTLVARDSIDDSKRAFNAWSNFTYNLRFDSLES
jgi:hypothetical protein